jgi:chemotaxis protein MotB
VPTSRLDECHRLSQRLQAENNRLKDATVSLRSQNQDLNQRAVDDARRLRVQEEEIQRLVQSVTAYQDDRDKFTAAFERIKAQIRTSASPVSAGLLGRLQDLARAHPGWELDADRGVLTIPAGPLFEPGSDRLRAEAEGWLHELAVLWSAPEARAVDLLVIGRNETSPVRRAAMTAPEPAPASTPGRTLGLARAATVRDRLAAAGGINPARIEVAGFEVPHAGADGDAAAQARNRRIEIHLRPHPMGDAAPPAGDPAPSLPPPPLTPAPQPQPAPGPG